MLYLINYVALVGLHLILSMIDVDYNVRFKVWYLIPCIGLGLFCYDYLENGHKKN